MTTTQTFETKTGTMTDLAKDYLTGARIFVDRIGDGRRYKRYRIEQSVQDLWTTPRQTTRFQIQFRGGTYTLRRDYPVEYRMQIGE